MLDPRVTPPARRYLFVAVEKLLWVPSHLRWDPHLEYELTWAQIIFYSLAAAVGSGNMYYSQPILNVLASDFVLWAALGDLGIDIVIVSTRLAIGGIDPKGQNVVNSVYMILTYCGQFTGTAVGNRLYADGGWIYSGAFGIGAVGLGFALVLLRGPHEDSKTWFGWSGGWSMGVKPVEETISSAMISEQEAGQASELITAQDERK
ncbi:hypothetical protein DL770_009843 [Monosporascus sp. CRB-9-2]|nr:hypothetical protein DL770_009843 [Monosporascus sp. CRB-9-2]